MALAMNHIGPKAYKPNDVVTASDGTTIEVVHTDAEGRMVLSDTLALASKEKPSLILDFATLTGGCMYSIGTSYSGVFTNKKEWHADLIKAGEDSGERVWPFPLDEDFEEMIKSDIADVKQCSQESGVDHILASCFLKRFVKHDTPWVHMDLSSSNRKGGLAHIPTDTIGFGVRYTVNLLLNNYLK
jgi:leucyl aminopeptidase